MEVLSKNWLMRFLWNIHGRVAQLGSHTTRLTSMSHQCSRLLPRHATYQAIAFAHALNNKLAWQKKIGMAQVAPFAAALNWYYVMPPKLSSGREWVWLHETNDPHPSCYYF